MTRLALLLPLALLAACDLPEVNLWACAGRSDLLVTTDGPELTILTVNTEATVTLTEANPGTLWTSPTTQWQIVGLDAALYTQNGDSVICRRPG